MAACSAGEPPLVEASTGTGPYDETYRVCDRRRLVPLWRRVLVCKLWLDEKLCVWDAKLL